MDPTRKEIVAGQASLLDPGRDSGARLFRDLELDGPLGLLLHDDRASRHLPGLADILHTQRDEITGA